MKKVLSLVLAAAVLISGGAVLGSPDPEVTPEEFLKDLPKCYVFYHGDPAENDWDFYCLPTYKTYVFYHGDPAENDWDFRYDPPQKGDSFYHSESSMKEENWPFVEQKVTFYDENNQLVFGKLRNTGPSAFVEYDNSLRNNLSWIFYYEQ
jgi:hypothetical protein